MQIRKDGSRSRAGGAIAVPRDTAGTLVGYAAFSAAQISARGRVELERDELRRLRALNAELELRVQSRTVELMAALRDRDLLLQEVHHRVKNNFQTISSLISMQVRTLAEDAGRDALLEVRTRVQAIALIHEKLRLATGYGRVPFSEYARDLAVAVFEATGLSREVSLDLAVDRVDLAVDKAIPCGLILNELVTNALKHAFADGRAGTVRVQVAPAGASGLQLVVADDGVGLPAGLDVRSSPSLGLQLVQMLTRQLDAVLVVETSRGTCFRLTVSSPD